MDESEKGYQAEFGGRFTSKCWLKPLAVLEERAKCCS